ncbi:MAG: helix-turn-helix domain-containing protein [Propionivibrio sp.]|uniref:Helix-turn-helix domain-containing protein n=1 Tax=Candidatus Propionivibrio dominans TaxID=2954373 RepID=A0A9D7FDC1_9RHOO|nr:helix-turn-helix domain-containing protein [Candidatus Propionivibrio dominans]
MSDQDVLDADAAAELLDIHLVTLRRLALAGRIPARKCGREWRFSRKVLFERLAGESPQAAEEARDRDRLQLVATSAGFVQSAVRQSRR